MHFGWHIISSYLIFNPFYQTDIFLLSVRIPQPYTMLPTGFVRAFRLRMCYPNKGVMDTTPHAWKSIMAFSEVSYFAFFILYTCFDTNCRRACIPLVSNLYVLRIRGADFDTFFCPLSPESLTNCENEKSQCITLRILKAHRFMQDKSLRTFTSTSFTL